ncbi:MAG: hypothetical protein V4714_14935 [Bacteroidota bacterium]
MKTLKSVYSSALALSLFFTSCSDESITPAVRNTNTSNRQAVAVDDITSGQENTLPVVTVIKNNFNATTGWRVTWKGGIITSENVHQVQSIFSTVTGAVNSVQYLNGASWGNTDNADMQLFFGKLKATSKISQLTNVSGLKETRFRLSTWNVATLEDAAKNNPLAFTAGYELGPFASKVLETGNYSAGQIYLFKTARPQPKYGAVRIVKFGGSEMIIEVVVQK